MNPRRLRSKIGMSNIKPSLSPFLNPFSSFKRESNVSQIRADEEMAQRLSRQRNTSTENVRRVDQNSGFFPPQTPGNGRGTPCTLPDDFLRPPGWKHQTATEIGDEQLALMLQDELFRSEIESELGQGALSAWENPRGGMRNNGASTRTSSGANNGNSTNGSIMSGLKDMSTNMRASLNAIALRFRSQSSNRRVRNDPSSSESQPPDDEETISFLHDPGQPSEVELTER